MPRILSIQLEKEKMQLTNIYFLFPKCFNPFPKQFLDFTFLWHKSYENNVGKGEIARKEKLLVKSNFSIFKSVFNWFWELSAIFINLE